jgi:Fur family ferric uptake transcriptional regulator
MLNQFEKFLNDKGLRLTRQRQQVVTTFLDQKDHVSAEELYLKVKEISPEIGYTTVYRTLKLLFEADLAHSRNFRDGFSRFEPAHLVEHHDHLICRKCGSISEFVNVHIEAIQEKVAKEHGFKITDHTLDIYGVCSGCQ